MIRTSKSQTSEGRFPENENTQNRVNPTDADISFGKRLETELIEGVAESDAEDRSKLGIPDTTNNAPFVPARVDQARESIHVQNIKREAPKLIARHGTPMHSANSVFVHMKEHGLGLSEKGVPLTKANCLGDALGGHGLNLPRFRKGGKMYYALDFVEASHREKSDAQERLNALTAVERKAMRTSTALQSLRAEQIVSI